jgi:RimJ/RimL family protein N-acetyltransferase
MTNASPESTGPARSDRPHDGASQVFLLDGSTVLLRRLDARDFDSVVRLAETLTDEERYLRFFTPNPAYLQAWARSLTECSSEQYALGAFDSEMLIGVANYVTCQRPGYAEVAVVVAHEEHLRGVGTALLRQLGLAAKQNGLHHFVADILAENHPMLRVMSDAGWQYARHLDCSVLEVDFDLDKVDPTSGAHESAVKPEVPETGVFGL